MKYAPILVKAGILSDDVLSELSKWGFHVTVGNDTGKFTNPEQIIDYIREVTDSKDQVLVRESDLDVIHKYLSGQEQGRLYLRDIMTGEKGNFDVFYCVLDTGEYVIPWRSENVKELLTDPKSYLKTKDGAQVHFTDVRELFFDEVKAFVVCEPRDPSRQSLKDGSQYNDVNG